MPNEASTPIAQFTTTDPTSGRTVQYSLVAGSAGDDSMMFTINSSGQISTSSSFSASGPAQFTIDVVTTDSQFSGLSHEEKFPLSLIQAPTGISISQSQVPNEASTPFAQFTTTNPTSGRTDQYSLVAGAGDDSMFTINSSGQISTSSSFSASGPAQFTIDVVTTDSQFPGLSHEEKFTLSLIQVPTGITSSTTQVPALANTQFAQLTTTNLTSGRTDQYSLVAGADDDSMFTITPSGALSTVTGFPVNGPGPYTIDVQSADTQFPGLFVDQVLNFTVLNAPTNIHLSSSTFDAASNETVIGSVLGIPGSSQVDSPVLAGERYRRHGQRGLRDQRHDPDHGERVPHRHPGHVLDSGPGRR